MTADPPVDVRTREGRRLRTWTATTPGMWAWLVQRIAAIALLPVIAIHVLSPYKVLTQGLLLTLVTFHALVGIRVLLIDLGVGVRFERIMLGVAAAIGLLLLAIVGRALL